MIKNKPYEKKEVLILELINETIISILTYFMIAQAMISLQGFQKS
jgi:hypothetical protein